ncbi:MAG: ABC transporter ATP-binding protein [Campylobacterota bacterium]|nr:ABC transporter ATP-binding protein [Campylobacterota bacterium]
MLEINNYSNYILKDISFLCENKDMIILGDNGAGKTTLAKVLSGLISSQSVSLDDKKLSSISYEKRVEHINYIPPKLDIFDDYVDVEEYLSLNNLYDKKHIDKILELLNIKNLKQKNCKRLSSGESQLLLLASAILHDARYTILDEPTSNLDPIKLKKAFDILKDKNTMQNKIIITHNLNLAYKLGYDLVFIKDGKKVFDGKSEEFFSSSNLKKYYGDTVKISENSIVVNI